MTSNELRERVTDHAETVAAITADKFGGGWSDLEPEDVQEVQEVASDILRAIVDGLEIEADAVPMLVTVSEMVEPHEYADRVFNVAAALRTLYEAAYGGRHR